MNDELLEKLGSGNLAGFVLGVLVGANPAVRQALRSFVKEGVREYLSIVDELAAERAGPMPATALGAPQPPSLVEESETPRRRRRRQPTEAEVVAGPPTAAAVETGGTPVAEAPARRRGRRPRAEAGAVPEAAPLLQQPAEVEPAPRTRRRRQQPTEGESVPAPAAVGGENGQADEELRLPAGELVNLNTATRGQLMRLPRIGAGAADRIIQFRETQGPIRNIRQLRQAEIIQPSAARQIRDLIRF